MLDFEEAAHDQVDEEGEPAQDGVKSGVAGVEGVLMGWVAVPGNRSRQTVHLRDEGDGIQRAQERRGPTQRRARTPQSVQATHDEAPAQSVEKHRGARQTDRQKPRD